MKLKTLLHLAGFRPAARTYGHRIESFDLPREGQVRYAQWLHPKETAKQITQQHVDQLRQWISPGDVVIDIGAHTGDFTLPLALAAGNTGRVLALEPNPFAFEVLEINAQLNSDRTAIEPLPLAAAAEDGPLELEYSDPGYCNGGRHEGISRWVHGHAFKLTVEGRNLQRYLLTERSDLWSRIRYLKVDAEGYDATILESLRELIAEVRPVVKTEFYKHLSLAGRQRQWSVLESLGYDVYREERGTDRPAEAIHADDLLRWKHFDAICLPREGVARRAG